MFPIQSKSQIRKLFTRHRKPRPQANPVSLALRRLNPVAVGFWLGGFVLGTAGAIVGACMPYRHPVAVTISILWWGIYFGCFGAYIGALLGLGKNRTASWSERANEGKGP
jgi:hypothetical protein